MTSFSIATISAGKPDLAYMAYVVALLAKNSPNPRDGVQLDQFNIRRSGPYLDAERNRQVEWYLNETTSDYLLFIDDDVAKQRDGVPDTDLPFDLIRNMARDGHAVASGVYHSFFDVGKRPVVYEVLRDEQNKRYFDLVTDKQIAEEADENGAYRAGAVGAGFLAIHRPLLYDMRATYGSQTPWFVELDFDDVHLGEDMGFCARAISLDEPPYVYPSIQLDHHKTCVIRGDET